MAAQAASWTFRLPFLGMPLAGGFGLLRIFLVLGHVRPRAVFADAEAAVAAGRTGSRPATCQSHLCSPNRGTSRDRCSSRADRGFCSFAASFGAGRGNRRARGVFAVGDNVQILQLAVRVGVARAQFVEEAPDKNRGMIDVLPDERSSNWLRDVFSNSGVSRISLTCGISAQTRMPAWSHRL